MESLHLQLHHSVSLIRAVAEAALHVILVKGMPPHAAVWKWKFFCNDKGNGRAKFSKRSNEGTNLPEDTKAIVAPLRNQNLFENMCPPFFELLSSA